MHQDLSLYSLQEINDFDFDDDFDEFHSNQDQPQFGLQQGFPSPASINDHQLQDYDQFPSQNPQIPLDYERNFYVDAPPSSTRLFAPAAATVPPLANRSHANYFPNHGHESRNDFQVDPSRQQRDLPPQNSYNGTSQGRFQDQNRNHRPHGPQINPQRDERNAKGLPISSLGNPHFEKLFSPFTRFFNQLQSECFQDVYRSDRNIVLSAPTGAGKTGVIELSILRLFSKQITDSKVIYIAPTRALCDERQRDWEKRFHPLGLTCKALTGDTPFADAAEVQKCNIIVTTPEKWDSVTRQWKDTHNLMKLVHLVVVDELHTIKDGVRGATLEAILTRMKGMQSSDPNSYPALRIVAVSATIPNLEDFGAWLLDSNGQAALVKKFGQEYRPVKLKQIVLGYPGTGNGFTFEQSLKYRLPELIRTHSNRKPTLVFCSTRKSTVISAEFLAGEMGGSDPFVTPRSRSVLEAASKRIQDKKLAPLIARGMAYHHGGLGYEDRREVETLFLNSDLLVICTTTTLAVGVNLPAHLVIIKGTGYWDFSRGAMEEYCDLDVLQMIGRAGRPQFDNEGIAVIMTSSDKQHHYQSMGKQVIESSLHESLIEHLNAEIALKSIKTKQRALEWLKSTFLYVRIKKNPSYYRLKNCSAEDGALSAEKRLEAIFTKDIQELENGQLVVQSNNSVISSTEYGTICCKYYLRFATMKLLMNMKAHATQKEVLEVFCKAEEFSDIRFRNDKMILNKFNKSGGVRFALSGKVSEVWHKVFLLVQACIGGLSITDPNDKQQKTSHLAADTALIMKNANRMCKGLISVILAKCDYRSIISALHIEQAVKCRMWNNSKMVLRQIEGIGPQLAKTLVSARIDSFEALSRCQPSQIEFVVGRNPPFGAKILEVAASYPRVTVKLFQIQSLSVSSSKVSNPLNIEISVTLGLENPRNVKTRGKTGLFTYHFIAGTSLGNFIESRKFIVGKLCESPCFTIKTRLKSTSEVIICSMICTEAVGLDVEHKTNQLNNAPLVAQSSFDSTYDDLFWTEVDCEKLPLDSIPTPKAAHSERDDRSLTLKEGYVPCKHHCKDKTACRHQCCREGVPAKQAPKKTEAPLEFSAPSKSHPMKPAEPHHYSIGTKRLSQPLAKKPRKIITFDDFKFTEKKPSNLVVLSSSSSYDDFVDFSTIQEPFFPPQRADSDQLSKTISSGCLLPSETVSKYAATNSFTIEDDLEDELMAAKELEKVFKPLNNVAEDFQEDELDLDGLDSQKLPESPDITAPFAGVNESFTDYDFGIYEPVPQVPAQKDHASDSIVNDFEMSDSAHLVLDQQDHADPISADTQVLESAPQVLPQEDLDVLDEFSSMFG